MADAADLKVAAEFFELFKTPWEPYRKGGSYPVVLSAGPGAPAPEARLAVLYGVDAPRAPRTSPVVLRYRGTLFPVYGGCSSLAGSGDPIIRRDGAEEVFARRTSGHGSSTVRIGYDLFAEVRLLLTAGQPVEHAAIPTLEIHVSILRDMIVEAGVPLAEIPPVPPGRQFILCLTHDVDFAGIRFHGADRTLAGFVYRASIGSLLRFLRGELALRKLLRNLLAVLSLPLVYLGLAKDFFNQFEDYLRLEGPRRSTFFLVPYKNVDGGSPEGRSSGGRATRYDVGDVGREIGMLLAKGCEVGLHGLDAWHDRGEAKAERERIREAAATAPAGVRMHWLFWSDSTPSVLEDAGFSYDSTCGYNERVGFRAGTTQVFRPLGVARLLELPLHIQDTALFFARRMNLGRREGLREIERIVDRTRESGGVLTVNWHDRSVGPERHWDDAYRHLLSLAEGAAWTATAAEAVQWFANRRLATFSEVDLAHGRVRMTCPESRAVPGLKLRLYNVSVEAARALSDTRLPCEIVFEGSPGAAKEPSWPECV